MSKQGDQKKAKSAPKAKEDRLKAALKENMAKRKAQARARAAAQQDGAGAPKEKNT
jgi:hypothetical protein